MLFAAAIGTADQGVRRSAEAEYLAAGGVEDDGLGALGAAVDAEKQVLLGHEGVLSSLLFELAVHSNVGGGLPPIALGQLKMHQLTL
ncbi:hypothetical protein, partial [Pseudomonas allii]|uniref:hypothetical protein n=1 Tax=Pseudomonas allii TaxID=2740531 RepID=UPI0031343154